jgi:hypothetical protein
MTAEDLLSLLVVLQFWGNGGAVYLESDTYFLAYADTFRFNWAVRMTFVL